MRKLRCDQIRVTRLIRLGQGRGRSVQSGRDAIATDRDDHVRFGPEFHECFFQRLGRRVCWQRDGIGPTVGDFDIALVEPLPRCIQQIFIRISCPVFVTVGRSSGPKKLIQSDGPDRRLPDPLQNGPRRV